MTNIPHYLLNDPCPDLLQKYHAMLEGSAMFFQALLDKGLAYDSQQLIKKLADLKSKIAYIEVLQSQIDTQ